MAEAITQLSNVPDEGTFLFTVSEPSGRTEEVILARLDTEDQSVVAWKNFCMHEPDQRLDRGEDVGAATREGAVICPRHGSMFDLETGGCDNGPARNQSLVGVDVTVQNETVYLTDDALTFEHEGGDDDDDDLSTTHMSF